MSNPTEEFISRFHTLNGFTIGERRRNLHVLLGDVRNFNDKIQFSLLQPKTPLEETFKVESLIRFREIPQLLEVLKSEKPALVKKVIKLEAWFWRGAFQNLTAERLATDVFPYVSFNVKIKILNKLAFHLENSERGDSFFDAIRSKYGLYLALKLLPCCSKNRVLLFIEKCGSRLSSKQLLIIVKKYPELSESLFETSYANVGTNVIQLRKVILHIMLTNSSVFLKLFIKYDLSLRLGWRTTHKFVRVNKRMVVSNAKNLHKLLHKKQCFKSLRGDFNEFYLNLFPSSIENFPNSLHFLFSFVERLRSLSDTEKLSLFEESFRKAYGLELFTRPSCYNTAILELLPLERRKNIAIKPNFMTEDQWTCYLGIDESIPLLKKRISLSSNVKTRETLLVYLVETCKINKNVSALLDVCKYVVAQHRNDHVTVRRAFLIALERHFKAETLDEEHWLHIDELIQIFEINRETFDLDAKFRAIRIRHRLLKNLPIDRHLTEYLQMAYCEWNLFENDPKLEKHRLLLTGELLPQIFRDCTLKCKYATYLGAVIDWNERHRADQISIFSRENIRRLREILIDRQSARAAQKVIHYCLQLKSDEIDGSDLYNLCLSRLDVHYGGNRNILTWLLQYKPALVLDNIDVVAKLALKKWNFFFWKFCRNYHHLTIPEKMSSICFKYVNTKPRVDAFKRNSIIALSYLLNSGQFLDIVSEHYSTSLTADVHTDESKLIYRLRKAYTGCLKNVTPASAPLAAVGRQRSAKISVAEDALPKSNPETPQRLLLQNYRSIF